jgi:hypothetical protein
MIPQILKRFSRCFNVIPEQKRHLKEPTSITSIQRKTFGAIGYKEGNRSLGNHNGLGDGGLGDGGLDDGGAAAPGRLPPGISTNGVLGRAMAQRH